VNARLTEEGASTLGSVPPLLHERFEERFSKLSEEKRFQVVNTLQDLAQMMDAEAIDASPFLDLAATANQ
jgi:DNA-binding MarR family transcriptional regulator